MTKQHFSPKEVFMFGWAKTVQHAWFITLTFIIASIVTSAVARVPVVSAVVNMMVILSVTSISLVIARNHDFSFRDLYTPLLSSKRVLKFILISIVYMFILALGPTLVNFLVPNALGMTLAFILLVIPAFVVAIRFMFYPYVVIEHENASISDLVKMSLKMTENHFGTLLVYTVLAIFLNVLGAMMFFVGLFVTIPITIFTCAYIYNRMKEHATMVI